MRLWSLSPSYLDQKRLVAAWRIGLLAQKVLLGETRGYRRHPQLTRFKEVRDPVAAIGKYLINIWAEATLRGYNFDRSKIMRIEDKDFYISVTTGQLEFELEHLYRKLGKVRQPQQTVIRTNNVFLTFIGPKESWERG